MKKFNFLTAIMLAFVANHSQAQISDVIASEMHGKVKSCTFYNSKFSHEEGDEYIFEEADVTYEEYDNNGFLTYKETDNGSSYTYKNTYTNGKLTLIQCYDDDGDLTSKTTFEKQGASVVSKIYKNGRMTEKMVYNGRSATLSAPTSDAVGTITYNNQWKAESAVTKFPYGIAAEMTYEYNAKGAVERTVAKVKNSYAAKVTEYDDYEYDSQGNWTTRLVWEDGNLVKMEEREIEYYTQSTPQSNKSNSSKKRRGK